MSALLWLLLPIAAFSGWVAATRHYKKTEKKQIPEVYKPPGNPAVTNRFSHTQPDRAVDIVIDKLEVSTETVEVHLALGKLYRKSGEVNRAIRFHQNLTEKHSLPESQRVSILFELGRDYLAAGLLDRAERIFKDLLTTDEFEAVSSKALIEVYQQEKEWDLALEFSELYEKLSGKSQRTRIGHYLCEKAEKLGDEAEKQLILLSALKRDKHCVRANILLGELSFGQLKPDEALGYYIAAVNQDSVYLSTVFDHIVHCFQLLSKNEELLTVLPSAIKNHQYISVDTVTPEENSRQISYKKSLKYAENQLTKEPTMSLLSQYILLYLDDTTITDRKMVNRIKDALSQVIKNNASYKCVACGIGVHALQWQCPSCTNWSTIKPI